MAVAATCIALGLPAAASGQSPATPPQTVTALGTGEVRPEPSDRNSNEAIRRSVAAARREAVPLAIASARRRAVEIGFASRLHVGGIVSVTETLSPFFGPFGSDQGTFGPGRFCGNVPRFRTVRSSTGRIVRRTRIGTRRICRVPSRVVVSLSVTYAATPKS